MSAELRTRRVLHPLGGNYRSYLILLNCFKHSRELMLCGKGLKGHQKHKKSTSFIIDTLCIFCFTFQRTHQNATECQWATSIQMIGPNILQPLVTPPPHFLAPTLQKEAGWCYGMYIPVRWVYGIEVHCQCITNVWHQQGGSSPLSLASAEALTGLSEMKTCQVTNIKLNFQGLKTFQ